MHSLLLNETQGIGDGVAAVPAGTGELQAGVSKEGRGWGASSTADAAVKAPASRRSVGLRQCGYLLDIRLSHPHYLACADRFW
jgi:hypothetical protein